MKRTLERELKLDAPEGFELPDVGGGALEARLLHATYLDAPDLRLARVGMTLRHRVENGRGLWQLKLPRRGARLELEVEGGPVEPPAELARLLGAVTRGAPLAPVAHLRTRRTGVRVDVDGAPAAEVLLDAVAVVDGPRVLRTWEEVEVELLEDGDERLLRDLGKALRRAGAQPTDGRTKLARALGLREEDGDAAAGAVTTGAALASQIRFQLGRILEHDPAARLGDDPEDVHQLRVAARRLRAFLRAAGAVVVPEWGDALRDELRWLGGVLGPVRDLDVLLERLRGETQSLEPDEAGAFATLLRRIEGERERHRAELLDALEDDRYRALLDSLELAASTPRLVADEPLHEPFRRELTRLRKAVSGLREEPSDEALHDTRIRVKRARYAAELGEPVLGKSGQRFVDAAKHLQDVLGDHQDAVVAEARLRALARPDDPPAAHVAVGRLIERERARRAAGRAGFSAAWRTLDAHGRRLVKDR